jgi:ABC-type bacteriocin/lantibiotic exporter with double-glycine peptidase domain
MIKSIRKLLGKKTNKLILLIILLLIAMFIEIIGLGAIIPVVTLISNPEKINLLISKYQLEYLRSFDTNEIFQISLIFLLLIFLIKSLFLSFLAFKQQRFLNNVFNDASIILFKNYVNKPYKYFTENNTSGLIKNLTIEISQAGSFLNAFLSIFVEIGFIVSILLTLFYIEPEGTLSLIVFFSILVMSIFKITKTKITSWADVREISDKNVLKTITEALNNIKDVKLFNAENFFQNIFKKNIYNRNRVNANTNIIGQLPRFVLEFSSVFGLVIFIFILIFKGESLQEVIPKVSVFVAAVFRSLPSINKLLVSAQNIKFYRNSLELVANQIEFLPNNSYPEIGKLNFNKKITIHNLSYKYSKESDYILKNLDLTINKGEMIGVIGESGAGKTTFLDLLSGLIKPSTGSIKSDNVSIHKNLTHWRKQISYLTQEISLIDSSIEENIAFGINKMNINKQKVNQAIKNSNLNIFINQLPEGKYTIVGEKGIQLSGGQRQRIALARMFYFDSEIILLDESTSALDNSTELPILNHLGKIKGNKTIIVIAHKNSTLRNCDKIFKLTNKKLEKVNLN